LALGARGSNFTYMSQAGATWTSGSDRRDKRFIEDIENKKSLDFINALKPVTYIY
jgi:hypothetical protein